ncbi:MULTISPECIES: D-alanyl-D-alanine carboxypeptidase family protein [Sphingobium]|uniref:serine-type D-Ala-D-Ala carboxypeptidase n=1 Tax=Sphingobium fuliginis (strain ATCC 27551) TaxID=336203 RepID=A0ABQ1EV89_SPHSA|nr:MULTISPECIES: D-alanyl-D-alanine carboxypeptidase family protein [Sphingobium]OAP33707.1 peptidase S11 [Sphingobium sp. 20006FA]AJR25473.1 peptidase S11 [Sphingobium sp. YBL2]KXU33642.1 peptidase S11 [Sphingobium sp. AM]KYC34098.1 peptidase S11 [Sphingobium sp. 22B]RYL98765.1 D-alanyl-D-alanine carboxypeptidase [Sphingobium fuliginis]
MKKSIAALLFVGLLSTPLTAAAPPYSSEAPIAYMKDLSSGAVLYNKGGDTRMPPASMAKMMTAHVAFRLIQKGDLKLDQKFTVRPETWQQWHGPQAGSTMFLSPGEQVSVENLLHGIVTLSGNDACVVLAEGIAGTEQAFVALMNQEAKRLGLKNSNFGTSNGWPDEGVTYVTAADLATLAEATIEETPNLYKKFYATRSFTWGKTMGGADIEQGNRNPILGKVAGADGLKTGHTQEAGFGFTGSAEQEGRRLVMVVAGLTSFNQRIAESVRFMDWGFRAWKAQPLFRKGQTVETAEVQLGSATSVPLVAPQDMAVTLPRAASSNISVKVAYTGPIKAPIAKGQRIAQLIVSTPDTPPQILPLVAGEDVSEAGIFGRLWNGLKSFFG